MSERPPASTRVGEGPAGTSAGTGGAVPGSAPARRAFFIGGDRHVHLSRLRHPSRWPRRMLLVTGPRGVGKSALYRQLSGTLEPVCTAAEVSGALAGSEQALLAAAAEAFGVAAAPDADSDTLAQRIVRHVRAEDQAGRCCVVLVDDAELLEPRCLMRLADLTAGSLLRVALFGEPRLVPLAKRAASKEGVGCDEIRLARLEPADARGYLTWRMEQQGYASQPFSDAQVQEITRLSEGLPGRIDQMADLLLARAQSAEPAAARSGFPALHRALVAVLVVIIAFAYLVVWQPPPDQVNADWVRIEAPEQTAAEATPGDDAGGAPEPAARDEGVPENVLPDEGAPENVAPDDSVPENVAADEGVSVNVVPAPSEPVPESMPQATEAPEREGAGEPASTRPEAAAEPQPLTDAPERVGQDASWIMRQSPSAYTLQLATFSTAERAASFVERQDEPGKFARYRLQQSRRILHVVIYGVFDGRAAAERAAAELPPGARGMEPWIRPFRQVQAAARTALQTE